MSQPLPDETLVVRGGQCLPENFANGSGVQIGAEGKLDGVSVNAAPGLSVADLTANDPGTGYPGIRNNQVGVTTVGAVRAAGGEVTPSPTQTNSRHATMSGITAEQAAGLFRPTATNPHRLKKE
jgi:hypothetical protein